MAYKLPQHMQQVHMIYIPLALEHLYIPDR
jgi:hypothetical protein